MTKIKTIFRRIQQYYNSTASVESDVNKQRDILVSYANMVKILNKYLTRDLIEKGKNGPLRYVQASPGSKDLPEPKALSTYNMILINSTDIFENKSYGNFLVVLCLGPSLVSTNLTGMFAREGYRGLPCVYIYVKMDPIDYSFGQVARYQFKNIIDNNYDVKKTYVHEATHFMDWVSALIKNPLAEPLKGYKSYRETPSIEELGNPNITRNYPTYVNQLSEVNARYSEWLVTIMYSFDSLAKRQKRGIIEVYPTFQLFWDYMWAEHAPDEFIEYATPKIEKYLKRRLYKFYDYVRDMERPPKSQGEARRLVQEYLKKDKTNAA